MKQYNSSINNITLVIVLWIEIEIGDGDIDARRYVVEGLFWLLPISLRKTEVKTSSERKMDGKEMGLRSEERLSKVI